MVSVTKKITTLARELFYRKGKPIVAITAPTPFAARMMESAGLEYIFVGGDASLSVMTGKPGLFLGLSESAYFGKLFAEAVNIPVIIDAGHLRALGAAPAEQASTEYIKVGLAGMDIDDSILYQARGAFSIQRESQYDPNHLLESGYACVSKEAMVEKIQAADEGRKALDPDFVIRVRCYAYMTPGTTLEEVIQRLQAYEEAGADVLYIRGPKPTGSEDVLTEDEIRAMVGSVSIPCTASVPMSYEKATELGLCEVRYPYAVEKVMHGATWEFLQDYQERGIPAILDSRTKTKSTPFSRAGT